MRALASTGPGEGRALPSPVGDVVCHVVDALPCLCWSCCRWDSRSTDIRRSARARRCGLGGRSGGYRLCRSGSAVRLACAGRRAALLKVDELLPHAEEFALLLRDALQRFLGDAGYAVVLQQEHGDLHVGVQVQRAVRELLELAFPVV